MALAKDPLQQPDLDSRDGQGNADRVLDLGLEHDRVPHPDRIVHLTGCEHQDAVDGLDTWLVETASGEVETAEMTNGVVRPGLVCRLGELKE